VGQLGYDVLQPRLAAAQAKFSTVRRMLSSREYVILEINLENRFCQFGLSQKPGG